MANSERLTQGARCGCYRIGRARGGHVLGRDWRGGLRIADRIEGSENVIDDGRDLNIAQFGTEDCGIMPLNLWPWVSMGPIIPDTRIWAR